MDRSIILAKGGKHWFYAHLFQKNAQDNISRKELVAFKEAAVTLGNLSEDDLNATVKAGKLKEICNDCSIEKGKSSETQGAVKWPKKSRIEPSSNSV